MDKDINIGGNFNHNVTINERKNIVISGVKKIDSFDNEEFLLETSMGYIGFSLLLDFNYRFIHSKNKFIKYFSTILIVILSILIYFIGIMKISYGIFHIYSILCIIIGYILTSLVVSYIAKRKRK